MSTQQTLAKQDVVHVIGDDDSTAMDQLNEILAEQGEVEAGPPPSALSGGSTTSMINVARSFVGYREIPKNYTKFNIWLGRIDGVPPYPHDGLGYPWCHSFQSYCLAHSGNAAAGPRTAGCVVGNEWFRNRDRWYSTPKVGDLVYYGSKGQDHVELVSAVTPTAIKTIGGNTAGSLGGDYYNGDGVYEKFVDRKASRIFGYGRPDYATGGGPLTMIRIIREQQRAVNKLGYKPKLPLNDTWGPKTEAGVKWLQNKVGTVADGEWGSDTEAKFVAYVKNH